MKWLSIYSSSALLYSPCSSRSISCIISSSSAKVSSKSSPVISLPAIVDSLNRTLPFTLSLSIYVRFNKAVLARVVVYRRTVVNHPQRVVIKMVKGLHCEKQQAGTEPRSFAPGSIKIAIYLTYSLKNSFVGTARKTI